MLPCGLYITLNVLTYSYGHELFFLYSTQGIPDPTLDMSLTVSRFSIYIRLFGDWRATEAVKYMNNTTTQSIVNEYLLTPESFTEDFKEIITECKNKTLFIGKGNPNSKILIIGKEIGGGNPRSIDDVINESTRDIQRNIESWSNTIGYPLHSIKNDVFMYGKNSTWTNYQKLICHIIGQDLGHDNYNFLDYCFMTEMNDMHTPYSDYTKTLDVTERKKLDALRIESLINRAKLFRMAFFRKFPVVIIASGHYPRKFGFDMESIFDVEWDSKTEILSKGNFYNTHHGKDKVLIHTRQMSSGVSNYLISEIGNICRPIYERSL